MTPAPGHWTNWSGLVQTAVSSVRTPRSAEEVVEAVRAAAADGLGVKMVGSGHSFTAIAATDGMLLDPRALRGVTAVDRAAGTVTVLAGTPLHELNHTLELLGLSLHNMGDIAEQTVAGAISTGTHGTGGVVASLSAQVAAVELVTGTGDLIRACATENPEIFACARIGLGALGLLTSVTFHVEPAFVLEAEERPMGWAEALADFDRLAAQNHHFELYWFPHTDRLLAKQNNRVLGEPRPLPAWRAHLDDELLANTAFGLVNRLGARWPRLVPRLNSVSASALSPRRFSDAPHRVFTSRRSVVFREMEYAVPREAGLAALSEARALIDRSGWKISFPVEIRVAPADDIALSTASDRDTVYLAFHTYRDVDHTAYFAGVEAVMRGYQGRPHWGKLHTRTAADLEPAFPRWREFAAARDRLDPDRLFTNDYLRAVLGS